MFAQRGQTDLPFRKQGHPDFMVSKANFTRESSKEVSTAAGDSTEDDRDSLSGQSSDVWLQEDTFQPRMPPPPQYYKKVIETPVSANLPADFATAWNAAANVSGWKREEPNLRPKPWKAAAKKPSKKTATKKATSGEPALICKVKAVDQDDRIQDMPLPKWFVSDTPTGPATRATACPHAPMQMPIPTEGPLAAMAYPIIETLGDGSFAFAMRHVKPLQKTNGGMVDLPLPGLCQQPLKISIPCDFSPTSPMLNMAIPCKKRVPDWGF